MDTCKPTQTSGLPKSLKFDLKIISTRNLTPILGGNLFVRYYLFAGNGKRIGLNSREILTETDPYWEESVSLECGGGRGNPSDQLQQQSMVFELRWRDKRPVLGRIMRSKLLGTAKIAWKDVLGSRNGSAVDRCIRFEMKREYLVEGDKSPALKISVSNIVETVNKREIRLMKCERCGCRDGECNVVDEDVLIGAAAFL